MGPARSHRQAHQQSASTRATRLLSAAALLAPLALALAPAAPAAEPGELDASFAGDGTQVTDLGSSEVAHGLARLVRNRRAARKVLLIARVRDQAGNATRAKRKLKLLA